MKTPVLCAPKGNGQKQKRTSEFRSRKKHLLFSVLDRTCFAFVGRNKMEILNAAFNRTRVSAHRRQRVRQKKNMKKKLRSASRRACLCRTLPCCHSKPPKTYNFEEAKKINKWLAIITYRCVCSCAKSQWPSAVLIWNWHCNDRNNHQISSLKEKKKLKTQNCILFIIFFVINFF